ncbi:hypothetical protein J3R30DRAFT_2555560 [Lentinula aciculospora]|uniref:Coiled-coil domain-containing protein 16 n=1 Tax=Lentinula aciculospora TaxID=153920 RepID=A0A9W9AE76_9AGAR|nr:hypothetical protein J3R30DRAFT_2555560 [Lentinula aciculospora]
MADVRALLKAKRQEARITHPLASYNQSGQLRCTACGTIVKHASAWEGHLGSKAHRTHVARLKEQERAREEQRFREEKEKQERILKGKRKAEDEDITMQDEEVVSSEIATKKQRVDEPANGFPADFFSDPSRVISLTSSGSDDEEEQHQPASTVEGAPATTAKAPLDLEWERFQREVVNAPDYKETYENATIFAEPVPAPEAPEGFPAPEISSEPQEPSKTDEEEARRQKELDERELIMDRLLEEERAQEEADMKVIAMKNQLELLRKKREAAKVAKVSSSSA